MTHVETVLRYRIFRHDDLPEVHKASYRARGEDPDNIWTLVWSFKTEDDAREMLANLEADAPSYYTYKIVDAGVDELREAVTSIF